MRAALYNGSIFDCFSDKMEESKLEYVFSSSIDLDFYTLYTYNNKTYSIRFKKIQEDLAIVSEVKLNPEVIKDSPYIICPFCNHEDKGFHPLYEHDDIVCDKCTATFSYQRNVSYDTTPIKAPEVIELSSKELI